MSRSWLRGEPGKWRMFCDVCYEHDARVFPEQPHLGLFFKEGWFIGKRVDACPKCVRVGNRPNDERHSNFQATP